MIQLFYVKWEEANAMQHVGSNYEEGAEEIRNIIPQNMNLEYRDQTCPKKLFLDDARTKMLA